MGTELQLNELAASAMLPDHMRGNLANLRWALEMAKALNMDPMAAVVSIHSIKGKPVLSAALMGSLVRKGGHKLRVQATAAKAVAEVIRADDPDFTFRSEWDMERARTAGVGNGDNWRKFPAQMLTARAISEVARMACAELLVGVYSREEMEGVDDDREPPRQQPRQAPQLAAPAADPPKLAASADSPHGFADDADRAAFCDALAEFRGATLAECGDWLAEKSVAKKRPEELPRFKRITLISELAKPESATARSFDAWLNDHRAAEVAADELPQDERGFHDD
mgnify:FL=1